MISISGLYAIPKGRFPLFEDTEEAVKKASPIQHVKGNHPPFLLVYADQDFPGCDRMSEALGRELRAKKVEAESLTIKDRGHVSVMVRLALSKADPATQALLGFVAKHSGLKLTPRAGTH